MIHTATDEVLEFLWYAGEENRSVQSRDDLGAAIDDESFLSAINDLVAAHVKVADHSWHGVESLTPLLPVGRILGKTSIEVVSVEAGD